MKTNIIANNTNMKGYLKYLCAVIVLLGMSVSAWGTMYIEYGGNTYDPGDVIPITFDQNDYEYGYVFEEIELELKNSSPGWTAASGSGYTYGYMRYLCSSADDDWYFYIEDGYDSYKNNAQYGTQYVTVGFGASSAGTFDGTLTIKENDYYSGTALQSGTFTLRVTVTSACDANATVTAGSNSSIGSTSATVSCASGITSLGSEGCTISSYGFVIGTATGPAIGGSGVSKEQVGTSYTKTGTAFSKDLTGLTASTKYYVRPYATNGNGTAYGTETSFTTKAQYTISYNNNGGNGSISSQTKDYDVTLVLNAGGSFSKSGYDLSKWHTDADGTSGTDYALGGSYTANSAATMYAVWTPANYTISLNDQDATSTTHSTSISVTYNANTNLSSSPAITVPTKTGYTFGGYYTETGGNGTQIIDDDGDVVASVSGYTSATNQWIYAGDVTLYAKWTADQYTITLNDNDATTAGTTSVKATYNSSTLSTSITNPEKTDKEFAGWYSGEGGTGSLVITTSGQLKASVEGYTGTGGIWTKTSGTTLYAKWVNTVYTVTYNMHSHGEAPSAEEVESGNKATKPDDPVAEDWRFLGWYVDDSGDAGDDEFDFASTTISANTTIHAKWEAVTYSTTYKAWCDPDIEITGNIYLTSVNGVTVQSTSTTSNLLRIQSDDLSGVDKLDIKYLDADNADAEVANASSLFRLCNDGVSPANYNTADGSQINVSGSNTCDLTYSIRYTPNAYNKINHYKLQITMKRGTRAVKTVTHDLYGHSLPEEFVIAAKNNNDNQWYALPNTIVDNNNAISPTRITVDNTTTPTKAKYAPSSTVYKGAGRYAAGTNVYGIGFTTDGTDQFKIRKNSNYVYLSTTGSSKYQDFYLASTSGATFQAYRITVPSDDSDETDKELGIYGNNFGYFKNATVDAIFILPIDNKLVENDAIVTEWGKKSVILDVDAQSAVKASAHIGDGDSENAIFRQTRTSVENAASKYNYTLSFTTTDFSAHRGELLYVDWLDSDDDIVSTSMVTIPWIIAADGTMSTIDGTKDHWKDQEVHVLPGVTLTADGGSFGSSTVVVKQLEIYPGATVNVTTGTLSVTNLIMRNGWTRAGEKEYDVSMLYLKPSAGSLSATNAYADWYIDFDQYYPIAVPWKVTVANMSYKNSKSAASAGVKLRYYDGASRASNIQQGVGSSANWKLYGGGGGNLAVPTYLEPSKGYAMTAKRPTGKAFSIVRMPLTIPDGWTTSGEAGNVSTTHKDTVYVHAWGDENTPSYAQGWNFVANPYMSLYEGVLSYAADDNVQYANIPNLTFTEYDQVPIKTTKLKPSCGFLIQAPKDGAVTFGTGNRILSAPSYKNTLQAEQLPTQEAYIVLNNAKVEDMMGLLISSKYTAEYELNADLEKLLGDGTSLKTYMHYGDMNMAYVAINALLAQEWIPVSVRIPKSGEYTYSLHSASSIGELEGVYLIDYTNNEITNLIESDYVFTAQAGTISNRFAINAIVGERQTPTAIDAVGADKNSNGPIKFLYHDKVFIWHHGVIYDATGKKVR